MGGTPATIQNSPWTVYVELSLGSNEYARCTGSIIDATHVVTAAHCLFTDAGAPGQPSDMLVDAGLSNFFTPTPTDAVQHRSVSSYRIDSGYRFGTSAVPDDVAVLTLTMPLDLGGGAVKAVALPPATAAYPSGASVAIVGFGRQDANMPALGPLASMTATVDRQGTCGALTAATIVRNDNATVTCATSPSSAVCNGDSGSGLITTDGTPTLVGIVVSGQCTPGGPAVAMNVTSPEILSFIQGNDAPPTAPRLSTAGVTLKALRPPTVGSVVTCVIPHLAGVTDVSVVFIDPLTQSRLQTGARTTYKVPASRVGKTLACQADISNAGGTLVTTSKPTAKVRPRPPTSR